MRKLAEFANKVVLITGAGKGTGRAIAEAFASHGALLALNDITPVNLDDVIKNLQQKGANAKEYIYDVAKKMMVQAIVEEVVEDWGRIDIMINNAAVQPQASILDMDEWAWHRTLDVNLTGAFLFMQAAGRVMRQQEHGAIVNIASFINHAPGEIMQPAFFASKMGLIGLTRASAGEFSSYGIRVNAVCTEGFEGDQRSDPATLLVEMKSSDRLERIAEAVLYLCSDAAADVTGQVINANHTIAME